MAEKYSNKLTDDEFFTTLCENGGMYSLTAKAIQLKFGISYSRQSVYERAQKYKDELDTMSELEVDVAQSNVRKFLTMDDHPELQYKMTIYVLNNRGGSRGYGKHAVRADDDMPEQVFEIGGKIFRF